MDPILILIFALAAGDLILLRVVSRERARRRKAERNAGSALRENLKLMDALERRATNRPRPAPVVVPLDARPRQIREAVAELKARQVADTGGAA